VNHLCHQPLYKVTFTCSKRRIKTVSNMKSQAFISPAIRLEPLSLWTMQPNRLCNLTWLCDADRGSSTKHTLAAQSTLLWCRYLACPEICTAGQDNLKFHCPVTLLPDRCFSTGILCTQLRLLLLTTRDESGTDIFRPYSRPNPFRGVLIRPYPSPDI
jgi:hypothetical protein